MSSFKDHLFKFIRPFFENQIQIAVIAESVQLEHDRQKRIREIEIAELKTFVGKPVIGISNEWDTPIIGFGSRVDFVSQAKNPVLCVLNYLDGQEYLNLGYVYHFTQQRFDALFKIDPFELCSFIYGRYCEGEFNKEKRDEVKGKEEVKQLLEAHGFYDRLAFAKQEMSNES